MTLKNFIDRMRKRILDRREQQKPRSSGRLRVTRLEDRKLLDASLGACFGVSMGGALSLSGFDTGDTLTADGDLSAGDGVFKLTSGIWDSGSAGLGLTLSGDLKTLTVALGPAAVTELNIDGTSTAAGQLANLASTTGLTVNNLNIADVDDVDLSTGTNDVVDSIAATNVTSLNLTDANSVNIAALTASGDVTISSVAGNITDSGGATIGVGGNADFDANSITLGDDPSDTTNFGTLTFSSIGSVDITEDSATELTADNDAGTLSLTTSGALTSASGTSLDVVNDAKLEADSIDLPNSAGGRMVNFGSVQFSAQGDVNLHENTGIHISADSESVSGDVTLNADGDLTMAAGVTLSADDIHLTANETTTDFGHIGSIADAFTVDGTTLTTFSNGDQVLASVGEISSFDLDSIDNVDTPAGQDPDGTNGAITLQSGTFVLNDPNNIVGDLSIATGAAITGTGIVTDITFDAGSVFEVDINGLIVDTEYDQLNASGDVVIAGTLHISDTIIPAHLSTFTIVNNSAGTTTGMFTGLAEGATIAGDNGQRFSISYAGGDGNDVVLTALTPTYDLSSTPTEYTYNENTGSGSATITVIRSGDLSIQSSVSVNVTADSATADDDFAQGVHTVTFEVGDVSKTFDVAIVNDQIVEADETIQIALVAPTSAALLGTNDSATLTIVDEDTATVTLSGATVTVTEGNSGTASLTFDVTLNNAVDGGFDIAYATNNGSAVAGSDYVDNDGTLSFTGGIGESHRITVVVNGDAVVETTEALNVSLAAAATASVDNAAITVAGTPLTGTITNDDSATLSIADNLTINEGDGTATFTIHSSAASQEDITVSVLLTDGTTSSSDVVLSSATATIQGDGISTSAAVTVSLTDDQRLEGSETFSISISSPLFDGAANAALVTLSDATANGAIADNDTATLGFTAASSNVDEDSTTHDVRSSLSLSTTGTGTAGLDRAVSFDVEVLTATATDVGTNADYTFTTKSVTFAAGSNGAVFNDDAAITIHEDLLDDDAETIQLTLTAVTDGSGGQLSTGTTLHTVTINDDDTATVGSLDLQVGGGDVIVQVNGLDLEIYVGGNLVATRPTTGLGSIDSLVINGSTSDESVTIDASSGTLNTAIQFNGGDGADTLQIINPAASTYNPTGGITFHGNAGNDTLELVDGTATSVEHQFTNNSDGSVLYNGAAAVTYTGLAPIVDTITATTRVFSFTGAAEDITLSDDGALGDSMSLIDSTLGESVIFLTATDSVTINTEASGGSGIDTISVQGVDSAWTADLVINAGNDDTVTFDTKTTAISSGDLSVTANNINIIAALTIADGNLTIDANSALVTNSAISSSGGVTGITAGTTAVLNGTVDGTNDLTLNVTGSTTFAATVGAVTAIGDGTDAALIINSTGATEFQSTVGTANGILQNNSAGTITFADNVTVAGAEQATIFNGNVVLDGLTFASVADVTFGNASTDTVGISSAPVVINTTNDGRVTVNAATSLGSDLTINTGAGNIAFNATVNGGQDLTVNSTGATTFGAAVGGTTALASLTTNAGGTTAINGSAVTTSGHQTYNDAVTLGADTVLTGTIINNTATVSGAVNALAIVGNADIDAAISGVTNFSVSGTTNLGAHVSSTGTQLYSSAVALSDDVTTTSVGLTFAAAVDGDFQLTADGGTGTVTFAAAVGAIARLSGLVVDAVNVDFDSTVAVDDQGLDVDASGTLSFDDAVSTTSGGAVTLSNGGAMTLAAAADFAIDGTFSQDGLGGVTTAADIITTADTISFAAAVTQTGSVLLDTTNSASTPAGANITLDTVAGGTNSLSLNAGSGGAIASGQVSDVDTLTIVDSATTVFSDTVSATTVSIDDSTTAVTFDGALTATNLTVAAGAYGIHLNAGGTITNAVTFNNTNGVTLGDDTGDILNFAGGVTSTASTTNIQGTLNTTGQNVTLDETTLAAATTISTGAAGGTITAGQVSGSGVALTLNAGTGNVLLANAANVIGDLIVDAADVTITEADGINQSAAWTTTGVTTLNAAANSINLTNAANQFGTLNLVAANATISETTDLTIGAAVVTSTISLTSNGSINDAASDTATDITATTIDLNAASGIGDAAELEVSATAISADTAVGNINIDNAAAAATDVTSLTSGNGDIDFDQSAAGNVEFSGPVSSGGGAITLAAVNELTVSSSVSSAPGTGGTLAIGGATIGGTVSVGAGDVSIQGGGVDLNINAQLTSDSHITLTAERDVIVSAVVDANSGSNIVITADSNSDTDAGSAPTAGHGGVQISAAGQLNAAGDITVTGSDVFATAGDVDSVLIAADTTNVQMLAGGQISISNGGNAPSGAAVVIDGVVQSTGGGSTIDIAAAGNVEFGSFGDVSTNDGAISITADTEAGSNGGQVVMADGTQVRAGSGTIDVTADGNVSLGQLNSTATVSVTSESGSIVDGGDSDVDIIAAATAFNAATGIGTDANALDTATAGGGSHTIAAQTDSGDIHLTNAGSLTVGTVGTVSGITITDDSGSGSDAQDSTLDNITLSAASPLTIAAAITNNDGGGISLTSANDGGSDDHLTINAALTITGGDATEDATGNIDLNAGTDLVINASASTDAAGSVSAIAAVDILLAGGNITTVDGDVQLTATAGQISMNDGTVVQSTTGDVTATAATSVAVSSITTNSNVNITATTAAITDSGDSAVDIIAATATLNAATGIGSGDALETSLTDLAFNNATSGDVQITNSQTLNIAAAGGLTASANAGGNIELCVTAGNLNVDSALTAAGNTIRLGAAGDITQSAAGVITSDSLGARATGDILLASATAGNNVDSVFAAEATAGTIAFADNGGFTVGTVAAAAVNVGDCFSQTVGITSTAGNVQLTSDSGSLTNADGITAGGAGNVTLATITLGEVVLTGTTTADGNTVTINSVQSINGAGLVTAATVDLNAESGIGNTTALKLVATAISADTTNGNIDINNALATPTTASSLVTGTGTITFDQSGTGSVNFGTATTTDGTIDLQNTGGDLTIDTAVTAGGGGNVLLTTAAAGDVVLTGIVTAAGNTVTIDSADQIIGDTTNTAADIVSDDAILNAANGIGDGTGNALETTINSLTVSNTNSGDVNLSNSQALIAGNLSNTVGSIELCIAVGNLTLTGLMDAGTNTVRLQTDTGSVIESGAGRITAGQLGVRAQNDVTLASNSNNVDTFAATATTGSVVFNEADGFAVDVVSAGDCFAEVTGITTPGSGDITLHALTGDLQVISDVTANTGNISLTANSVTQNANIATTAAGTIDIVADNGSITMADGTATSTATGTIVLAATNNVGISQLTSTAGNITVTADSHLSGAGAMTDVTAAETANISTTGLAALSAATGIGAAGVADIDTTITTLQATNTTSGDIVIEETDALIVAGTGISNAGGNIDVDVTAGDLQLTAAVATTGDNVGLTAVAGSVSSTAASTIVTTGNTTNEDSGTVTIDAANNVSLVGQVDTSGLDNAVDAQDSNAGDITLTATAGDIRVTNLLGSGGSTTAPTILGAASNITLNAGNDVHVISAIADNGTSVVEIDAGNNVTIDLLTANGLAATNTGGGDIDITAANDVLIDSIIATGTAAQVNITATAGDIVDNNDNATIPSTVNITTPDGMTRLSAGGSIGVVPTAGGVFKPTASGNAFEIRSDNVQILAAQNANVAELGSGTVQILSADTAFISSAGDLDFSTAAVTTNNLALNVDGTLTLPPAAGALVVADDLSIIAGNVEAAGGIDITADRLLFKSGESEEITIQGNAGGPIAFDGQTTTAADGDLTINVDTAMALTDLDCDEFALDVNDNIAVINAAGVVIDQADQSTQAMFDSKIRSGSLVLNGSGTYDLTNPLNDTDILAGNNTGDIAFKDIDDVTVDTVNVVTNTASTITGLSTNNGNVQLDAGTTLTINQQLNAGTGDIRLISHGDLTQAAAGIITANALGIQQQAATGDIRLAAQNDVNVLAATNAAAAGSLTFADLDDVIVGAVSASTVSNSTFAIATGITTNNGNITIDAGPAAATPDSLAITEQVNAGTADVRLIADGNITQTADGTITADKLGVRQQQATGNIVLDDANAVNELAALNTASGGQVAFRNTQPLVLQTVTALDVAAAPTANAVSFAETNGVVTNNGDVLIDVDGSLTVNQQLNVGTAAARILAAGNVTQSATGTIIANELGIRQQGTTGDITLGAAANDVNTIAAENAAVSGQIAFFDADELTVSEVANLSIGNLTFATTTGINTNAGNINITSEGDLVVTEEINAAHETIITSIDESITLTSRNGNFTLADNTIITSDENPAAGVFDDITADAITIIAGSSGTNGTVDLGDNIEIRTDGGVAKQVAPRPTAFATAGTVNDAAFVTLADAENSRANLTFVSAGFLGILDLVIGVAGEENLEIVVDWGAISQTNLTEFGPAGDATNSTGVPGALEFGLEDGDKSTFYIDEGGQEYLIPHIYAVGDLTTTDNDRNGRETNPSIFGVRFSVAQHASINIWGSDAIDPTTGTPDTAPADFTGTSPTLTDATGAAINPAATSLALLSSTDTNNLRDFSQEAAQLPLLNDDVTTTGRPVGLAEWEFVAGPSPGLVLIQATPRPTVEVAKIDAPFYTPVVSEISDTLHLSAGASSDAAIGTEVYLQIRRYFELDAEAEVVIARITDSDFIANRESFESFVEENPELQDGAGYEVWLITETSGQRVERPIVKFEITGGRPGPATEVLPDTFEPYELKELEFEQPAEDGDVPAESHSESNATSAVDPTDGTQPANDDKVSVKFTGEQDSASDIAAAVLLPAVTLTRAARWKRQQQQSATQDKGLSRTARTLRRMRETT